MLTVTFTQLRNHAKKYFDAVENGESVEVYRKGKPIARMLPITSSLTERWKTGRPVKVTGASLSRAILSDRRKNR